MAGKIAQLSKAEHIIDFQDLNLPLVSNRFAARYAAFINL